MSDLKMEFVPRENTETCEKIKQFVERHEWLGKMPTRPTHRFIATYKGHLAGVIVMATPNCFSNLLGKENRNLEKLISRGACISWSPKNLGSALVMFAIRWMTKNTEFRYFTAYSDTEARELGTIYQACNFIYLGQSSGARFECFDPNDQSLGNFSDRLFRRASFIKRKAVEAGIEWDQDWQEGEKLHWNKVPEFTRHKIKHIMGAYEASCEKRRLPPKHKYVYIQGQTKAETKRLKKQFEQRNRGSRLPYPKDRAQTEEKVLGRPCRITPTPLTKRPNPCWPTNQGKRFYSIREVVSMYGISQWLIYHHIKMDPTFPVVNVGIKKRFLIEPTKFEAWLEHKTKKFKETEHSLASAQTLLEYK